MRTVEIVVAAIVGALVLAVGFELGSSAGSPAATRTGAFDSEMIESMVQAQAQAEIAHRRDELRQSVIARLKQCLSEAPHHDGWNALPALPDNLPVKRVSGTEGVPSEKPVEVPAPQLAHKPVEPPREAGEHPEPAAADPPPDESIASGAPEKHREAPKPDIPVHTELREGFTTKLRTGKLLVIWVLDSSLSMLDDYGRMKEKIDYFYEVEGLKSVDDMRMAVVIFSKKAAFLLKPTSKKGLIRKAFDNVPPGSGEEYPMAAVAAAVRLTNSYRRDRIIVLMTDERGLDNDSCDSVGKLLKRKNITFFAVTPQSRFLVESRYVHSANPKFSICREEVGLEDPVKTRLTSWAVSPLTPGNSKNLIIPYLEIPAGTSFYACEHLASVTGGKCIYLEEGLNYDKAAMKPYLPDYSSYASVLKNAKRSNAARALEALIRNWNRTRVFNRWPLRSVMPKELAITAKVEAVRYRAFCESQLKNLSVVREKIISRKAQEKARKTPEPLRRMADLDLAIAQLRVASFHLGQYIGAIELWWNENKPPFGWGRVCRRELPVSFTTTSLSDDSCMLGGKEELAAHNLALRELDGVISRHPGTPWSQAAWELKKMWTIEIIGFVPRFGGAGGVPGGPGKQ